MATHKHKTKKVHHRDESAHHGHHHAKHTPAHKPKTAFWIGGVVILFGILYVAMNYSVAGTSMDKNTQIAATKNQSSISAAEKKRIDKWIIDASLNVYGDKKDTFYIGGTPLFDESTGKYSDRYKYIIEGHSDRPWNSK